MDYNVTPEDYKSSHKFGHNPLAEALHVVSLDSNEDETAGTVADIGWHALFHFEHDEDVEIQGGSVDNPVTEATVTVPKGSYILMENDQGFVYVASYPLRSSEVERDWDDILAAESDAWDEENDENYP